MMTRKAGKGFVKDYRTGCRGGKDMETNDILERTLAQEKSRYEKFCRIMYALSTVMAIFFVLAAVFCLIATIVQEIQYKNNGGETDMLATVISALYVALVLGGVGLLWNAARHIFRRLKIAETPFCYDIADKIKGAGFLAILVAIISGVYRLIVEVLLRNGVIRTFAKSDGYLDIGYPFIGFLGILGIVLMIVAYVFNYGCKLQQEADETL